MRYACVYVLILFTVHSVFLKGSESKEQKYERGVLSACKASTNINRMPWDSDRRLGYTLNEYVKSMCRILRITKFSRAMRGDGNQCQSGCLLEVPDKIWKDIFAYAVHWDLRAQHEIPSKTGLSCMAACDTRYALGTENGTIMIYGTGGGTAPVSVECGSYVTRLKFMNSNLLVACGDEKLTAWDLEKMQKNSVYIQAEEFCVSGDTIYAGAEDGCITIWNPPSKMYDQFYADMRVELASLATLAPDKLAMGTWDGEIRIIDLNSRKCITSLRIAENCLFTFYSGISVGSRPIVTGIVPLSDTVIVSLSDEGFIRIWDITNSVCAKKIKLAMNDIYKLHRIWRDQIVLSSPNGGFLACNLRSHKKVMLYCDRRKELYNWQGILLPQSDSIVTSGDTILPDGSYSTVVCQWQCNWPLKALMLSSEY